MTDDRTRCGKCGNLGDGGWEAVYEGQGGPVSMPVCGRCRVTLGRLSGIEIVYKAPTDPKKKRGR